LPQHEDNFFAFRDSVTCRREANSLDYKAAFLEKPEGRPVAGSGGGDQRTLDDFLQQQVGLRHRSWLRHGIPGLPLARNIWHCLRWWVGSLESLGR